MSTVDSLLLLVSSTIVKDVYINYIKPDVEPKKVKRISMAVTALLGTIVLLLALNPPDLIIWLNLFAIGGLEAAFLWPIVMGLYWKKGNKYGALASMLTGIISYVIFEQWWPQPLGMHSVVSSLFLSLLAYVLFSLMIKDSRQIPEKI